MGPRPALPNEVAAYNDYQRQRLLVKPGMTCYWQTRRNRDSITFDEWVDLDLSRFEGAALTSQGSCSGRWRTASSTSRLHFSATPSRSTHILYYMSTPTSLPRKLLRARTSPTTMVGGGKDVVIHLKNDLAGEGEPRYKDLPLHRILPPSTDSLVPLPLLKLELPRTLGPQGPKPRKRKNKPGKRTVDIDTDCDVVEIFMTSREWSIGDMQAMLPDLMGTLLTTPFEAWASNSITVNQSKAAVIPHGEGKSRLIGVKFDQVDLVVLQYPQPFMPTPDVIRVTFIENELAEPIMLHMQSFFTKDGCHCLTRCPKLDDILMPDYMRVHNLKHQDVWVRALRFNLMARQQYDLLAHRVDRGRLDLVLSIRARDAELESAIASTRKSVERVAGDGAIGAAVDSFGRHVALAREIGALPAFIHSTRLSNESLGVDEDYAFLTIGGDIDVHFDIARLCDLAGVPAKEMTMRTEGRPFEDGLAGLRTHLKLMGYRCSATTTFVLIEPEGPESLPVAVPLYEADVLSGQYRSLPEGEREKLHEMVGGDLRAYLAHLYAGFPLEAGPYVLEITSSEEVDGKVCHKTRVAGRIDDALWDEVSRPARSFISAYRDIRRAFLELDRSYEEFVAKCAKENVERMASKRGGRRCDSRRCGICRRMLGHDLRQAAWPHRELLASEGRPRRLGRDSWRGPVADEVLRHPLPVGDVRPELSWCFQRGQGEHRCGRVALVRQAPHAGMGWMERGQPWVS